MGWHVVGKDLYSSQPPESSPNPTLLSDIQVGNSRPYSIFNIVWQEMANFLFKQVTFANLSYIHTLQPVYNTVAGV